ncbi:hypothetical protein ACX4MT_09235 [Roseomonas mucosa]
MFTRFRWLWAASIFIVSGCAAPVTHNTASGKPEVTVTTSDLPALKSYITNDMINRGYTIVRESESQLVFDRPVQNVLVGALVGSSFNSTPNTRLTYVFIKNQTSYRVVGDVALITNPGSGFEKRNDMNAAQDTVVIQQMLERMRATLTAI